MIAKGETAALRHTTKGRERILVALSWDEREGKITFMDKLRGTNQQHDLDLACFIYDDQGTYIDFVGAMAQDSVDSTGAIYHSGDDATGEGLGDDESISVELAGLPHDIKDIIFVVEIRSDHTFSEINNPTARVADGASDTALLDINIARTAEAQKRKACVLARLTRHDRSPTGWNLHHIDEYPDLAEISDWGSYLTRYI